ncbi:uncharacterized protein LOC110038021 [Phalaenopsis equestris]|uniref:uncharacterized protein LOC110038021 n=1 Tax=Phalaenopsis equestris TaxID=78828 RepID=UPI0009E43A78|nr:uncharacterized protein LOC110038021 [Phalaenopsis equestris]
MNSSSSCWLGFLSLSSFFAFFKVAKYCFSSVSNSGCGERQRPTRREMRSCSSCGTISCSSLYLPFFFPHFQNPSFFFKSRRPYTKTLNPFLLPSKNLSTPLSLPLRPTPLSKVSQVLFSSTGNGKETEIELLGKPSLISIPEEEAPESSKSVHLDDALAPFLKFFKAKDLDGQDQLGQKSQASLGREILKEKEKLDERTRIGVEYYDPKPGDLVVGVVVSGNDNKLDVNVGADMLGTMLTKEVLPFYDAELAYLCCDLGKEAEDFMVSGKMGLVKDEVAMGAREMSGRSAVEMGTVLFAEVLGRTLSGRPLLSCRRMFRRVAWHRVRQIKQFNEPIEVKIFEWNTGGLLTRIEGLRAFLPKAELLNRVSSFMDLKKNVGRRMFVSISRIDETTNVLIISEREAWDMHHLKVGTLLEGSICKIFPFGAQVRIGETNRSGLLHISNISRTRVASVSDVLEVDERVKILVVKSMFPDKISLSIADLESKPGLFLSDKQKVFSEAEDMARRYKQKTSVMSATPKVDQLLDEVLPFDDEAKLYANWEWFKFE